MSYQEEGNGSSMDSKMKSAAFTVGGFVLGFLVMLFIANSDSQEQAKVTAKKMEEVSEAVTEQCNTYYGEVLQKLIQNVKQRCTCQ